MTANKEESMTLSGQVDVANTQKNKLAKGMIDFSKQTERVDDLFATDYMNDRFRLTTTSLEMAKSMD